LGAMPIEGGNTGDGKRGCGAHIFAPNARQMRQTEVRLWNVIPLTICGGTPPRTQLPGLARIGYPRDPHSSPASCETAIRKQRGTLISRGRKSLGKKNPRVSYGPGVLKCGLSMKGRKSARGYQCSLAQCRILMSSESRSKLCANSERSSRVPRTFSSG
jgi:hypothetical protein